MMGVLFHQQVQQNVTVQQRVVAIGAGVPSNNTSILLDEQAIDPYVHAMH